MTQVFSSFKNFLLAVAWVIISLGLLTACSDAENVSSHPRELTEVTNLDSAHLLVFTKTTGWRHDSIPAGIDALQRLARDNRFTLEVSEDVLPVHWWWNTTKFRSGVWWVLPLIPTLPIPNGFMLLLM